MANEENQVKRLILKAFRGVIDFLMHILDLLINKLVVMLSKLDAGVNCNWIKKYLGNR